MKLVGFFDNGFKPLRICSEDLAGDVLVHWILFHYSLYTPKRGHLASIGSILQGLTGNRILAEF